MAALRPHHAAVASPSLQTAIILRVILAFEVFAVVAALGGTNLPVLMGETYTGNSRCRTAMSPRLALLILAIRSASRWFFLRVLRVPRMRDMSAVVQAPVARDRRCAQGRDWLLVATVILLCVWVLLPIYLLIVNALSSPER